MSGLVTKESDRSVEEFIAKLPSPAKVADSRILIQLIQEVTGHPPKIWGNEKVPDFIIGFGRYTYYRKQGKNPFEWFHVGFAPRKSKLTIYLTFDLNREAALLAKLGKCQWGKGCLYLNKVADINLEVLRKLIELSKDARWHSA